MCNYCLFDAHQTSWCCSFGSGSVPVSTNPLAPLGIIDFAVNLLLRVELLRVSVLVAFCIIDLFISTVVL